MKRKGGGEGRLYLVHSSTASVSAFIMYFTPRPKNLSEPEPGFIDKKLSTVFFSGLLPLNWIHRAIVLFFQGGKKVYMYHLSLALTPHSDAVPQNKVDQSCVPVHGNKTLLKWCPTDKRRSVSSGWIPSWMLHRVDSQSPGKLERDFGRRVVRKTGRLR